MNPTFDNMTESGDRRRHSRWLLVELAFAIYQKPLRGDHINLHGVVRRLQMRAQRGFWSSPLRGPVDSVSADGTSTKEIRTGPRFDGSDDHAEVLILTQHTEAHLGTLMSANPLIRYNYHAVIHVDSQHAHSVLPTVRESTERIQEPAVARGTGSLVIQDLFPLDHADLTSGIFETSGSRW